MADVPNVLGSVKNAPADVPFSNLHQVDNSQGTLQVFERYGQIGKQLANTIGEKQQEAKHDADQVRVGDSMTALEKSGNDEWSGTTTPDSQAAADAAFDGRDVKEGYSSTRGARATELGPDVFDRLSKRRQQLLEQLDNDDQKKRFKQLSDGVLDRYYGQIEAHSAHQREQQKLDTVKNAEDEAVRSATLNPADDKRATASIANVVGLQESFTTSTGDAFAKADAVQARITTARLESLLAQPGGFTDAERVLEANKGSLGTKYDDYKKRVDTAKLGGTAAVVANSIVDKASAVTQDRPFAMPDAATAERELAKLPPALQEKAAPIVMSRIAMLKQARSEERAQFVNTAVGVFNKNAAVFFASDIAERLNKVDAEKYKDLKRDAATAARLAGDNSSQARREQAQRNEEALNAFKELPPEEQAKTNIDAFVAGRGVDAVGRSRLGPVQRKTIGAIEKGDDVPLAAFVKDYADDVKTFAPAPGKTNAQKDREREWWAARRAEAFDAYTAYQENHPGKKPNGAELAQMKSELIVALPLDYKNPESIKRATKALVDRAKPPPAPEKPTAAARARALKDSGLSREDIAKQLTAEGY